MGEPGQFVIPPAEKSIFTLDSFLVRDRILPEEYSELIQVEKKHREWSGKTSFSYRWQDLLELETKPEPGSNLELIQRFFKEHIKNQALVDLGGGPRRVTYMYNLAKLLKAKAYIDVDVQIDSSEQALFQPIEEKTTGDFYEADVNADMLDFVAHMKDGAANFAVNGIDSTFVYNREYTKALANELVRATHKGGIIFGVDSVVGLDLQAISKTNESPIKFIGQVVEDMDDGFVFEKI